MAVHLSQDQIPHPRVYANNIFEKILYSIITVILFGIVTLYLFVEDSERNHLIVLLFMSVVIIATPLFLLDIWGKKTTLYVDRIETKSPFLKPYSMRFDDIAGIRLIVRPRVGASLYLFDKQGGRMPLPSVHEDALWKDWLASIPNLDKNNSM